MKEDKCHPKTRMTESCALFSGSTTVMGFGAYVHVGLKLPLWSHMEQAPGAWKSEIPPTPSSPSGPQDLQVTSLSCVSMANFLGEHF